MVNSRAMGDLGFVANSVNMRVPNRTFFGAPGNPSKKGVALYGPLSKMNVESDLSEAMPKLDPVNGSSMITKRTEWLESQERKLSATMADTRSGHNRLAEQIAASLSDLELVSNETKHLQAEHAKTARRSQQLYEETQWVYGKTAVPLRGILCSEKVHKTLEAYRNSTTPTDVKTIAPANKWVLLSYPMERVDFEGGHQFLMKVKTAHPQTGQLEVCWAIVYEVVDGKEKRIISKFDMVPQA